MFEGYDIFFAIFFKILPCRAQTNIIEGEEITAQYLTPLVGTLERRRKIR
jgi:hypothetical protein